MPLQFVGIKNKVIRKLGMRLQINVYIDICIGLQINIIYNSSLLFIPLGSSVKPLSIRNASQALRMESQDVRMSSNGISSMS